MFFFCLLVYFIRAATCPGRRRRRQRCVAAAAAAVCGGGGGGGVWRRRPRPTCFLCRAGQCRRWRRTMGYETSWALMKSAPRFRAIMAMKPSEERNFHKKKKGLLKNFIKKKALLKQNLFPAWNLTKKALSSTKGPFEERAFHKKNALLKKGLS